MDVFLNTNKRSDFILLYYLPYIIAKIDGFFTQAFALAHLAINQSIDHRKINPALQAARNISRKFHLADQDDSFHIDSNAIESIQVRCLAYFVRMAVSC